MDDATLWPNFQAALFDQNPYPMWIYDLETLRFLRINDTAVLQYGYSRETFLQMTLRDIRLSEDIAALEDNIARSGDSTPETSIWQHRLANGELVQAEIQSIPLMYEGRRARLVTVRDVSELAQLTESNTRLQSSVREWRRRSDEAEGQFQQLFEAAPGKFLVLTPDEYRIAAVSDAYLEATMTRRADIIGQLLFDVFPGDPSDPAADGVKNLLDSLQRVVELGMTDIMPMQRYPIRRPDEQGGGFEERYWSPVNTPVKNAAGSVVFIIHHVEDVTEIAHAGGAELEALGTIHTREQQLALDMVLRTRELQAAYSSLREQETNLRTAQHLLGLATWKFDIEHEELIWSPEAAEMLGQPSSNLRPELDKYLAMLHPEDRGPMLRNNQAFINGDEVELEFSHRIVRFDGQVIHIQGIGEKTRDSDNRPIITGVVLDVTRQKLEEARLRESDLMLQVAGQTARLGAWRLNFDRENGQLQPRNVIWSTQTCHIHEVPPGTTPTVEEAVEYYAPEYRKLVTEVVTACVIDGTPFDEVLEIITARGNRVWVRTIGEADRDQHGRVIAIHGAFQDISELMQAKLAAEKLESQLERMLEKITDGFYTLDRNWNFTYLNTQAELLLERRREDLLGRNVWEEFPEALGITLEFRYRKAVEERTTERFTLFFAPLNRWFEVNAYPSSEGLAVYFNDVTDRQQMQEQLRRSQKLEAIGQLTGGIAHDFNNLLTVIIGNAELLTSQLKDQATLQGLANMIMTAAESGAELTRRLLAFSRRQALEPQCVCLNRQIEQMDPLLRRSLGEEIEIEFVQAGDLWLAEIDPAQFESALLNLAINSRDAMTEGGNLSIRTENVRIDDDYARINRDVAPGEYVRVAVRDNGCGMSAEVAERAFDPFFTTKTEQHGSGLGLSMVYGFLKQSGGFAKIDSQPDQGTTINLYFPRSLANQATPVAPETTSDVVTTGKECILVVEDDDLVRENLVKQLQSLGYQVLTAVNGVSALKIIDSPVSLDLLLTDVVMPGGMNGRVLADQATARRPGLKVLFSSGYSENAIVHGGRLDPGVQLLSKPYRRIELARKVRKVLDAPAS
jgi:PAS domain S-box-containing protein